MVLLPRSEEGKARVVTFITSLHRFIIIANAVLRHDSSWTIEFVDIWIFALFTFWGFSMFLDVLGWVLLLGWIQRKQAQAH